MNWTQFPVGSVPLSSSNIISTNHLFSFVMLRECVVCLSIRITESISIIVQVLDWVYMHCSRPGLTIYTLSTSWIDYLYIIHVLDWLFIHYPRPGLTIYTLSTSWIDYLYIINFLDWLFIPFSRRRNLFCKF